MTIKQSLLLLLIGALLLVSCNNSSVPSTEPSDQTTENGLPNSTNTEQNAYPGGMEDNNGYPVPQGQASESVQSGYPAPSREYDESKRFRLDRPIPQGAQVVSGTGPSGISIRIASVSNIGETLGVGVIDENGMFEISLHRPLESSETVAIMLADDSLRAQFLDAPDATDIPFLGFVLDMTPTDMP